MVGSYISVVRIVTYIYDLIKAVIVLVGCIWQTTSTQMLMDNKIKKYSRDFISSDYIFIYTLPIKEQNCFCTVSETLLFLVFGNIIHDMFGVILFVALALIFLFRLGVLDRDLVEARLTTVLRSGQESSKDRLCFT